MLDGVSETRQGKSLQSWVEWVRKDNLIEAFRPFHFVQRCDLGENGNSIVVRDSQEGETNLLLWV